MGWSTSSVPAGDVAFFVADLSPPIFNSRSFAADLFVADLFVADLFVAGGRQRDGRSRAAIGFAGWEKGSSRTPFPHAKLQ
jgi:hypothetical protein